MTQIKLSIKINNIRQIELNELTCSLNALAKEYDQYCKDELNLPKNDRRLEIVKLEQGSLLIEMIPVVIYLLQELNPVFCFGKYFIETLDYFTGKSSIKDPPRNYTKKNCDNTNNFLNQTANDNGSHITINVVGNNNSILVSKSMDSLESNAAQNNITKYKDKLLEEEPAEKHKQAFYWAIASFARPSGSGSDKGIIENLDSKAHKIIFDNEIDKREMTKFNDQLGKEWQDLIYIVDVIAIKVQDVIKIYKILKVYTDDTTDPDDS